jgi:serralysin
MKRILSVVALLGVLLVVLPAAAVRAAPRPASLSDPGQTVAIMALGDSYAAGSTLDSANGQNGYRSYLLGNLVGPNEDHAPTGPTLTMVGSQVSGAANLHHEGHPGYTVAQIVAGVQGGWLTANPPQIVILTVGSNDFGAGHTWQQVYADYSALLDLILAAPSAPCVVVTEQIIHSGSVSHVLTVNSREQQAFNAQLPAMVASKPTGRVLIARTSRLRQQDLDSGGVHPTNGGYQRMEWEIYEALTPLLGWADGTGQRWMANRSCPYDTCAEIAP